MSTKIKIALLGASGVGKTALACQFIEHTFVEDHVPTLEETYSTTIRVDDDLCSIQILDTSGQNEYKSLREEHITKADGIIFVFSYEDPIKKLGEICLLYNSVLSAFKNNLPPMVLIGNKCDSINKQITKNDAELFARSLGGIPIFESSAKERICIDEPFFEIARMVLIKKDPQVKERNKRSSLKRMSLQRLSLKAIQNLGKRMSLNLKL